MERFSAQQLHGIECKISSQALVDLKTLTTVWIDKLQVKIQVSNNSLHAVEVLHRQLQLTWLKSLPKSFEQGQRDQ